MSDLGTINETRLMPQVGRVHGVVCAYIGVLLRSERRRCVYSYAYVAACNHVTEVLILTEEISFDLDSCLHCG